MFDDEMVDGPKHSRTLLAHFTESIRNIFGSPSYHGVECVKGVVASVLTRIERNPSALKTTAAKAEATGEAKDVEIIAVLAERLHAVVRQLRQRIQDRATLDVGDEYDLQDLFHALLVIYFDDIRREEWVPSYAGGASRMDFLLPEIETVVELKMTRPKLSSRQLGDQLIVDIAKYQKHPGCRTLFCVVYDPDGRISNPRGVQNDLNRQEGSIIVRVMMVP